MNWSEETMKMINDLTPQIVGKSFDPGWFVLRQRLEEVDQRDSEARAIIEQAAARIIDRRGIRLKSDTDWLTRARKWLAGN